jgi:hypothetical protein
MSDPVPPSLAPPDTKSRLAPWVEGLLLAMVVLVVVSMGGEAVRTSYHGYLHTTLGEAVMRDGLMPENPYHAGEALRYYTLYPTLGVLLGRFGMGPLWGFAVLNLLAALLLGPALDALGRRLGLSFLARRGAFLAMVLGFNGLGWWFRGEGPVPPDGAQPLLILRDFTAAFGMEWDARLQSFLPKLFNVSSFALALPFALAALAQLLGGLSHAAHAKARLQAGGLLGLATAINPLVGIHTALLFTVMVLEAMRRDGAQPALRRWLPAAGLAVVVALPFLLPLMQSAPEGAPMQSPDFPLAGDGPFANLVGPLAALVLLGIPGWLRLGREGYLLLGAAVGAAFLMSFLSLPWDNEYKFPRVAAIFLALPAGLALAPSGGGRGALAWAAGGLLMLGAMVPTAYRTATAYAAWTDAGLLPLAEVVDGRLAPTAESAARGLPPTVAAAEAALPRDAVVAMFSRHPVASGRSMGATGNRLAPVLHHSLFVDEPQIHNQAMPDLRRRLDLQTSLWTELDWARNGPGTRRMDRAASLAEMRGMLEDRGLAILSLDADEASRAFFAASGGERRASESGVTLWWFPPTSAAGGSAAPGEGR